MSKRISNHARRLNGYIIPTAHEIWTASVLSMQRNPSHGIDLLDNLEAPRVGVEVKFILTSPILPESDYPSAWTTQNHQVDYNDGITCHWALGQYQLDRLVKDIKAQTPEEFESHVAKRELWLVAWDWMNQYPPSTVKYGNIFRYAKKSDLPETQRTIEVKKGLIHLTGGVSLTI